jgi:hypothetical protein
LKEATGRSRSPYRRFSAGSCLSAGLFALIGLGFSGWEVLVGSNRNSSSWRSLGFRFSLQGTWLSFPTQFSDFKDGEGPHLDRIISE